MHVLLVGATGVFGRRLAEQLVNERGIKTTLASRTIGQLEALHKQLGKRGKLYVMNRDEITAKQLGELHCDIVIDAAGPFQHSHQQLILAAINSGCHYIDLADGREFVTTINQFDQHAKQQNVAALSGASSTPALSQAVITKLTKGWRYIDSIKVAISPGNRAPRGLSVMQAILSYAGQPIQVFRDGQWTQAPGWGLTHQQFFPGLGNRLLSLCDTPDLDLLVDRFQPKIAAEFYAGLELKLLHRGLQLCSQLVRWRLVRSLRPWAKPMRFLAAVFEHFGTDHGGMFVDVTGIDQRGEPVQAQWSLFANAGHGPYVPTFAALALVRQCRDQQLTFRGAAPCIDILTLDDFDERFCHFNIQTQ